MFLRSSGPCVFGTVVFLTTLFVIARPGGAQSVDGTPPLPLPARDIPVTIQPAPAVEPPNPIGAEQRAELDRWMVDFTKWKQWSAEWGNRRERGWFTDYRERREKPAPPLWLAARCASVLSDLDTLALACSLFAEWKEDFLTIRSRPATPLQTAPPEQSDKMVWWEHVHVDVLWPAMQWRSSVYGVIGVHTSTTVAGRWQVFVAPGAMLLNLPTRYGTRAWKVATNYGIGYRLFDFAFPGGRLATLHVNMAKAWLLSDVTDVVSGRTTDFAGFSITFKRNP
jgi:hypothetical protein